MTRPKKLTNKDFLYEGPGYYFDTIGRRWLVGEDMDLDLVGINIQAIAPDIQYWNPCGRVIGSNNVANLIGPSCPLQFGVKTSVKDFARHYHRRKPNV